MGLCMWKSFHGRALNKSFKLNAEKGRNIILENETKQSNIFWPYDMYFPIHVFSKTGIKSKILLHGLITDEKNLIHSINVKKKQIHVLKFSNDCTLL